MTMSNTYYTFDTPDECLAAFCPTCGALIRAVVNTPVLKADIRRDTSDWRRHGYNIQCVPRQTVIDELTRCHCRKKGCK